MAWQTLPVQVAPVLPGTVPVLRWFAAERGFAGTDPLNCAAWSWLDDIKWDRDGLVPVIAQEAGSSDVLMFAWMNREALAATAARGAGRLLEPLAPAAVAQGRGVGPLPAGARDPPRLRQRRRAAQGHAARPRARASPATPAATAASSSASRGGAWQAVEPVLKDPEAIYRMSERQRHPGPPGRRSSTSRRGGDPDKSYVARLFSKGTDAILKKVGEEATEVVMAAKDGDRAAHSSARSPTCGSTR